MKFNYYILFFLLLSCKSQKIKKEYTEIRKHYIAFKIKGDSSELLEAYDQIYLNSDFKENGLTNHNLDIVFPVLYNMSEFDSLNILVFDSKIFDDYKKSLLSNTLNGLKNLCDCKDSANFYFRNNNLLIINQINNAPNDTSIWIDYFQNRLYLVSIDSVEKEVLNWNSLNIETDLDEKFFKDLLLPLLKDFNQDKIKCNS